MFQRQTPQPFPVRNIIFLAAIVIAALVFILKNMQPVMPGPPPPTPPVAIDSTEIKVQIDSLAE